jgi:hypothetical protein
MVFREFVERLDPPETDLVVLNRTANEAIRRMLAGLFGGGAVSVTETDTPSGWPTDVVALRVGGETVATSKLAELRDALLLVNSDLYVTGARGLDGVDTPSVLVELDDTPFYARNYPAPEKRKLLLIEMSRHVEAQAWRSGGGRLSAGFQGIGRIDGEPGTREVYERLGGSGVDVEVYGAPDPDGGPTPDLGPGVGINVRDDPVLRETWFVTHRPPSGGDGRPAALLAVVPEGHDGEDWVGYWTHDPDEVAAIEATVRDRYGPDGSADPPA